MLRRGAAVLTLLAWLYGSGLLVSAADLLPPEWNSLKFGTLSWRQVSSKRVRFTLSTAWAVTDGGPKLLDGASTLVPQVGDRVLLTDSPGTTAVPLEVSRVDRTDMGALSIQTDAPKCEHARTRSRAWHVRACTRSLTSGTPRPLSPALAPPSPHTPPPARRAVAPLAFSPKCARPGSSRARPQSLRTASSNTSTSTAAARTRPGSQAAAGQALKPASGKG